MKCPNCSHEWIPERDEILSEYARLGGSTTSRAKTRAARRNAKLGGWPKGKKRGKRKPDANQLAHSIVAAAVARIDNPRCHSCEKPLRTPSHVDGMCKRCQDAIDAATQQGRTPRRLRVLPSPKSPKAGR